MSFSSQTTERLEKFKRVFTQAWMPQDIYTGTEMITVQWPDDLDELCDVQVIMRHESGRIYAEANTTLGPDTTTVTLGKGLNAPAGCYDAIIRPKSIEYYNGASYERKIGFYVVNDEPSSTHYGDLDSRRVETLQQAARHGSGVYSELAKLALGQEIREKVLLDAIQQEDPDLHTVLGLLFMVGHYSNQLPAALAATLNSALRRVDYTRFNHSPVAIACRAVDAVLYKRSTTTVTISAAREWLHDCAANGFDELEDSLMALVVLVELVDDVAELSAVVLDKLLYTVALYPSASGFDARISPLSPVTRFLWGIGNYNHFYETCTLLACTTSYEVPSVIQAVAITAGDEPLFARDAHRITGETIQRTIYRTQDYSLVSRGHYWLAEMQHVRVYNIDPAVITHHENHLSATFDRLYWPTYAFDEWTLRDSWAFGRVGTAYIAVYGGDAMRLLDVGRELRAEGIQWQCCMGHEAEEGGFEEFIEKTLAAAPFQIEAAPLPKNRHYESIYATVEFNQPAMDIHYQDYLMRLDFSGIETREK